MVTQCRCSVAALDSSDWLVLGLIALGEYALKARREVLA